MSILKVSKLMYVQVTYTYKVCQPHAIFSRNLSFPITSIVVSWSAVKLKHQMLMSAAFSSNRLKTQSNNILKQIGG